MAQKKKVKKTSWLKTVFIYIFIPVIIWSLAFFAWLYWDGMAALFSQGKVKERPAPRGVRQQENAEKAPVKPLQEKILDDDRKKLEEILKQRQ